MSTLRRRWRKISGSVSGWRLHVDRPYRLLAFALLPLFAIAILEPLFSAPDMEWLRDQTRQNDVFGPILFPRSNVEWKDRLQGMLILMGLPVAFCLWYWRDRNQRDQIENSRKDVNLKEFQEVQMRAAGTLAADMPSEARVQLQIAALHQLRGFLRGDYGESFRRPAFELLLAGHSAAITRIGLTAQSPGSVTSEAIKEIKEKLTEVDRARITILGDDWKYILRSGWPLRGRNLDLIHLSCCSWPQGLDPKRVTLRGAFLEGVNFDNVEMAYADLECISVDAHYSESGRNTLTSFSGARLHGVNFRNADLITAEMNGAYTPAANFEGVNLSHRDLKGTYPSDANFEGTNLRDSNLQGTYFGDSVLDNAILTGASFDDKTGLLSFWHRRSAEERASAQRKLLELGAVYEL